LIADIKQKIASFGLTAQDLGLSASAGGTRKKAGGSSAKKVGVVKYRGPNGETWSGGRGRKPQWVVNALAAGKSLDEFLV
jgi:DNA-binding protein H-NS